MPGTPGPATVALTINRRPPVRVPAGVPLLTALRDLGVFVPSACGGRGACGLCKLRVERGAPAALTESERRHLTAADQRDGLRLACQVPANADLSVRLPESYFSARAYRAEVAAIRDLTHDIRELELRLVEPQRMPFRAGQYIQLQIPPAGPSAPIAFRSYSIASAPSRSDRLELEIRCLPHGLGSAYVFQRLRPGDPVRLHGPHGDFYLRDSDREILLVAGGSGMAPMKAMLEDMRDRRIARPVRFFFGARSRRDLFLLDAMRRLEGDLADFRFVPALSHPLPGDAWDGETGLITDVIDRRVRADQPVDAYLCGAPAMLDACLEVLDRKGIAAGHTYYDAFARAPGGKGEMPT